MEIAGLSRRLAPIRDKLAGKAPACPWRSILHSLDPRTLNGFPPKENLQFIKSEGGRELWRFADLHDVWFPAGPHAPEALWTEYLSVFWDHPSNGHRYHRPGTPVEPGDVCIDCGACEGFFGLHALDMGAARVVCLEPFGAMAECLRQTFAAAIGSGRVSIVEAALGAVDGEARFAESEDFFAGKLSDAGGATNAVKLMTLGEVCRQLSLDRVDFLKMDIEGAELQALDGAIPILQKHHPKLAITTYHRAFDFAALKALLVTLGYDRIEPAGLTQFFGDTYRPVMLHAWVSR